MNKQSSIKMRELVMDGVVIHSHEGKAERGTDLYVIRNGIVVIPKKTIIPRGTTIE
jgi:hypothetical protein